MRFVRVLATTVFCVVLFLVAAIVIDKLDEFGSLMKVLGAVFFLIMFLLPYSFAALAILTVSLFILDRLGVRRVWPYVLLWIIVGGILTQISKITLPIALPVAALTGAIYWVSAGRVAGKPGFALKDIKTQPFIVRLAAGAAAAYIAFVVFGWVAMGGKMLGVTVVEPPLGEPAFNTEFEREMTARMKVAIMDFPDPQSCVDHDAGNVTPGKLVPLDWDKIGSQAEASVCMFRLLATYGDVSMSGEWFEGQGFRTSTGGFSAKRPNVNRDGTLRVHASWSIREKGLRYKPRNFFIRAFASLAYGMGIYTAWSSDGKTLLWVNVGFNTL